MRREREVLGRLYVAYHEANNRHFAGLLPSVVIELWPMSVKRRGDRAAFKSAEFVPDPYTGAPRMIHFNRDYALRAPWPDVMLDLLHEMAHVWQAVRGYHDHHGLSFKREAKRLGISERAVD